MPEAVNTKVKKAGVGVRDKKEEKRQTRSNSINKKKDLLGDQKYERMKKNISIHIKKSNWQ